MKELVEGKARDRTSKLGFILSNRGAVALKRDQISRKKFVAVVKEEETLDLCLSLPLCRYLLTAGPRFGLSPGASTKL